MRLAHISDLHFGSFALSPLQFLSKRWLGNFYFLLKRRKEFDYKRLNELIALFKDQKITHVLISGDLSVTSRKPEFAKAKEFIDSLKKEGLEVFVVPGNHDHYTKTSSRKKTFYRYFDSKFDPSCPMDLKKHRVTYTRLNEGFWLVGLDTAVATSPIFSGGEFFDEAEEHLKEALKAIPSHEPIILLNHFPFFLNGEPKTHLRRAAELKSLISQHQNVQFYLSGHSHRQTVADLRPNRLPILSDSGSTPHIQDGACHLFELTKNRAKLYVYRYEGGWKEKEAHAFTL